MNQRRGSRRIEGGALILEPIDDACFARFGLFATSSAALEPVADVSVAGLPGELDIVGIWEDSDTAISFDGAFYELSVNGEAIDTGSYSIDRSPYRVTMTSDSGTCEHTFLAARSETLALMSDDEPCAPFGLLAASRLSSAGLPDAIVWTGSGEPRRYVTSVFDPRFEFDLGAEWNGFITGEEDFHLAFARGAGQRPSVLIFRTEDRGDLEETLEAWSTTPGVIVSDATTMVVDGAEGLWVDIQTTQEVQPFFLPGFGPFTIPAGADNFRVHFVDVDGTVVTILAGAAETDGFDQVMSEVNALLDSITWIDSN